MLGQNSLQSGQLFWSLPTQLWSKLAFVRLKLGQNGGPSPGQFWSTSPNLGTILVNFGPTSVEIGPTLAASKPILADSGHNLVNLGRLRPKVGRLRQTLAEFSRIRPAPLWPRCLANVDDDIKIRSSFGVSGPNSTRFGCFRRHFGQIRIGFRRVWVSLTGFGPNLGPNSKNLHHPRSGTLTEQRLASVGRVKAAFRFSAIRSGVLSEWRRR